MKACEINFKPESVQKPLFCHQCILFPLANDADSSASNDTHEDPLITSRAQDSNKLEHEPVEKERSSTGSRGSVNSGLESDTERETDVVVRRAESSRSDAPLTRMNKTYV